MKPERAPARAGSRSTSGILAGLLDRVAALRPLLWIPAIALFEAGRMETPAGIAGGRAADSTDAASRAIALAALLGILGAVHVWNAWRDRASDRANRKGTATASGRLSGRSLALVAAASALAALVLAARPGVTTSGRWLLVAAAALGALYTTPPVETKRRAGLDLATQASGYGVVAFLLGASTVNGPRAWPIAAAAAYASGVAALGLVTMMADARGDRLAGERTSAVAWGAATSRRVATVLAIGTVVAGLATARWVPALWGIATTAWLALGVATVPASAAPGDTASHGPDPSPRESARWIRGAIVLQLLLAALLLPRTAVPLVAAAVLGLGVSVAERLRGGDGYPLARLVGSEDRGRGAGPTQRAG